METVYRAYVSGVTETGLCWWIDEGTTTGVIHNGKPMVQIGASLVPMDGRWRKTRRECRVDAWRQFVDRIQRLQGMADKMLEADDSP